ncbi:10750_t:CDS:10 [Acaulospora morrowiae]|uniref:10750_t:CDS:1 n=1 Tax=Acaulospora morrowiae TaxID=94023 RepID=A0A9N8ZV96_9GLOM|nr:10750_t:CDS:10 [Acaulospora morrowiae]
MSVQEMNTSNTLSMDELIEPDIVEPKKWQSEVLSVRDPEYNAESTYKSPFSSTGSLATFVNTSSISENEMSPSEYYQEVSSWESKPLSTNESSLSLPSYNTPQPRRRTLSSTSRSQERFSMHELGSVDLISGMNSKQYLSPTRHSVALDNGFDRMMGGNSNENRERNLDRERIGNAGKGFGSLISDDGEKESIAELIANVKDEDAFKLAQKITQMHASQKSPSPVLEVKSVKTIERNDVSSSQDHCLRPSEATLSKSEDCKKYLEEKYREIFKIIENHETYHPVRPLRERQAIVNRGGNEYMDSVLSDRTDHQVSTKRMEKSLSDRQKEDISQIGVMKNDMDSRAGQVLEGAVQHDKIDSSVNGDVENEETRFIKEIENHMSNKNLRSHRRLSQIFIPTSPHEENELGSPTGSGRGIKHSRAQSLNSITTPSHEDISKSKSRGWSLHLFKRKDKKLRKKFLKGHQKPLNDNKGVGIVEELFDDLPSSSNSQRNLTDSSSNDQTPRSSAEFTHSSSDKERGDSREMQNENIKFDRGSSKAHDDKRLIKDDNSEDHNAYNRWNSFGTSTGLSDSSIESTKDVMVGNPKIRIITSKDPDSPGYSNMHRSLSEENKTIEITTEYEGDSEGDNEPELLGETVSVKLDVLPNELVREVMKLQEKGRIPPNDDNSHYIELDIGLCKNFKFNRLVGHGVDLLELRVSLGNKQKSIDTQETEELIMTQCDNSIEETEKILEINEEKLFKTQGIIRAKDQRFIDDVDVPLVQSPISTEGVAHFQEVIIPKDFVSSTETLHKLKRRIDEEVEALNDTMVIMESTVKNIENQHVSLKEDIKVMLDQIQELTLEVNNDYFRQLKVLEDDIHLLIAEQKKSSVLDIFYLTMSYVLAGIMFMFCLIVAGFKIAKRILSLPRKAWRVFSYSR